MKPKLTVELLQSKAAEFAKSESSHGEPTMYGVTDGKAVGTYLEQKFKRYLSKRYAYEEGNAARGIDFPLLRVDVETTSIRQPQSSCPYRSARQKIYGLGYSLLIFIYEKTDDHGARTAQLNILHVVFVESPQTGDFQMTKGLRQILDNEGNRDDLVAFMMDKNLPVEEIELNSLADELLTDTPPQGYLTISNALQWRLQYRRVIEQAGKAAGVIRIH